MLRTEHISEIDIVFSNKKMARAKLNDCCQH